MDSIAWLTRLIAFDTVSRNSNLALIDAIADWLENFNIPLVLTKNPSGEKANLFATIPAQDGNATEGGIIFSGHTDVVPVDGQDWDSDPFLAKLTADCIYGRGACDMKGFLAAVLAAVPQWVQAKLSRPLHLAFSYDEEVGCQGVRGLISDFQQRGIRPAACIVGEPTDMRIVVAHKGIHVFHVRVLGCSAHSSLTTSGCNAIEYAAELIAYIRTLADRFKAMGPFDAQYDVAFSTLTTNRMQGGIADNIIPNLAEFYFELRNLPEVAPEQVLQEIKNYIAEYLLPKMQAEYPEALIEIVSVAAVPGLEGVGQASIIACVQTLLEEQSQHKVSYATEAGLFQHANVPTIVCGPGNIAQAHKPNEFVSLEQLRRCDLFLRNIPLGIF